MPPRLRVLVVGIDYTDTAHPLRGALEDAGAIRDLAAVAPSTDIRVLLSHAATRDAILQGWTWLFSQALAGDQAVFYFSGHGVESVPPPPSVPWCALLASDLHTLDSASLHTCLVLPSLSRGVDLSVMLDCCHSGSMCGLGLSVDVSAQQEGVHAASIREAVSRGIAPGRGTAIAFAAATASQRAGDGAQSLLFDAKSHTWDTSAPHGTFTNAVLDVLHHQVAVGTTVINSNRALYRSVAQRLGAEGVVTQTPVMTGTCPEVFDRAFWSHSRE